MPDLPDARHYRHYADLASAQCIDVDYRIIVSARPGSSTAIVAPHGGGIEDGTSEIATAIAGIDHHLYLLEGCRRAYNYRTLHLTSHRFDEPQCLALVASCERVITVHGCDGEDPVILIGGLDSGLGARIAEAMSVTGLAVATHGHRFPATHPDNICNRGASRRGVQIEVPHRLRRGESVAIVAAAVRAALGEGPG